MLAKVLVFAAAVAAGLTQEHGYKYKTVLQHEQPKEYSYAEHNSLSDYASQEHAPESQYHVPESHGHAISSQSIVRHPAAVTEESHSQEQLDGYNSEPVSYKQYYQDEQLNEHAPVKYVQAVRYPVRHEAPSAHHQTQYVHVPTADHHQSQHEAPVYHQAHQAAPAYHQAYQEAPAYHQVHQEAPVYHQAHQEAPAYHQVHQEAPAYHHEASHDEPVDYYAYPKYQYEYKVEDPHTGDNKFHHEIRDGDSVKGVYSLHEADGSVRIVEYSSDKHHGFNAVVKHTAPGQHVHIESHHQN